MSKGSKRRPVDEESYQSNWDKIFSRQKENTVESMLKDLEENRRNYTFKEYTEKYAELLLKATQNETLPDIGHPQSPREGPASGC